MEMLVEQPDLGFYDCSAHRSSSQMGTRIQALLCRVLTPILEEKVHRTQRPISHVFKSVRQFESPDHRYVDLLD